MKKEIENIRRVEIHGHQEFWRGWFHLFTSDGMAIIETDEGQVNIIPAWKVKFVTPRS